MSEKGKEKEKNKELLLPPGGGPFKGFGFVVVSNKEDALRILKEWDWTRPPPVTVKIKAAPAFGSTSKEEVHGEEEEDDIEKMMDLEDENLIRAQVDSILADERAVDASADLTVPKKQREMEREDLTKLGKDSGLRATTLSVSYFLSDRWITDGCAIASARWRVQMIEYPPYRLAQLPKRPLPNSRTRSPPPHLARRNESTSHHPAHQSGDSRTTEHPAKRFKQGAFDAPASSDSRNGAPHRRESFFEEEKVEVGFPKGTILWIRGINDKSTKSTIRSLFGDLLNELRGENSATGIAFVDFEKGLDTVRRSSFSLIQLLTTTTKQCHLRLSSPAIAKLLVRHFDAKEFYHLTPTYLSSTSSLAEGQTIHQPKIRSEILQTEREFIYWTKLARSNPQVWKLATTATAAWEEKYGRAEDHEEVVQEVVVEEGMEKQVEFLKPKASSRKKATKF